MMRNILCFILLAAFLSSCASDKQAVKFDPRLAASETGVDISALPDFVTPATATDSIVAYDSSIAEGDRITEIIFPDPAATVETNYFMDGTAAWVDVTTFLATISGDLGTPSALVGTNISGTAANLTAGTVSTIDGLAPNTATTQATQASITTAVNLVSVGAMTSGSLAAGFTDVPVAQGGTGVSTLADGGLLIGNAAGVVEVVAAGATTEILVGGGASTAPVWTTVTGTGAPVRATTPTLVTPIIGVATGTSLDISGAAGLVLQNDETITNTVNGTVAVSGALAVSGVLTAYTNITAATSERVLTTAEVQGSIVLVSFAGEVRLPDVCDSASGASVMIVQEDPSEVIEIAVTDTSDHLWLDGVDLGANYEIDSAGDAIEDDYIVLVCKATNNWHSFGRSGDWVTGAIAD